MRNHDAIVVGAGAMGSSAAWQLAKRGRDVLVLERFEQGHKYGGSHGGSRVFRLADPEADYVRLAQSALPLWRELEADSGLSLLDQTGGIDHGHPRRVRAIARSLSVCGAPFEILGPQEAAERWTGIRFDREVIYQPGAGRVNADLTLQTLNDGSIKMGAELHFNEGVFSIRPGSNGVIVRTERGGI